MLTSCNGRMNYVEAEKRWHCGHRFQKMFKISFDTKKREREYNEQSGIVLTLDFWNKFLLSFFLHPARTESDLNAARAGRFVDREKYVELEQDGDGEEDGVDDETDETQGPGEEEPSD